MNVLNDRLMRLGEEKYADFQAKLTPGIPREKFIGVRVPLLRSLAKEVKKMPECAEFLCELPHGFYDEDMLHAAILSEEKDYDEAVRKVEAFLPFVDNWAVCDTLKPKAFKARANRLPLLEKIRNWCASTDLYTCRFGMEMLMNHYLDGDFRPEYLEMPAAVCSEEYYVNMMIAWFYATALAKQWDATIPYLTQHRLSVWTHNKTIQKSVESFRITDEQKKYLRSLRRKE